MLDSPFVRRVAVAMLSADVEFEHKPLSVFRHYDDYEKLSPMVKAPSLIADDGSSLVDSGVILDYLGARSPTLAALRPRSAAAYATLGLALTVMEKAVQFHYERALRGPGEQSESWRARVTGQLHAGLRRLDEAAPDGWVEAEFGHSDIAVACAWTFTQTLLAGVIPPADYPGLAVFAARAESLPAFLAAPPEDGVVAKLRKARLS